MFFFGISFSLGRGDTNVLLVRFILLTFLVRPWLVSSKRLLLVPMRRGVTDWSTPCPRLSPDILK